LDLRKDLLNDHGIFPTVAQSMEASMTRWNRTLLLRNANHLVERLARLSHNPNLHRGARVLGPTILALSLTSLAQAQGTIDFSGAQTLMGSFKNFAVYAGAVICFGGLIFAGIRMMSGRFQDAIPGLFGALFGAAVLGWGAGWIGSLTGQSM
jgi:hypothetical protein